VEELQVMLDGGADDPRVPVEMAAIRAAQGETAEAVIWLGCAYHGGFVHHRDVGLDPMFDSLRGDPEFERVIVPANSDAKSAAPHPLPARPSPYTPSPTSPDSLFELPAARIRSDPRAPLCVGLLAADSPCPPTKLTNVFR
jgi:hypothetical protein